MFKIRKLRCEPLKMFHKVILKLCYRKNVYKWKDSKRTELISLCSWPQNRQIPFKKSQKKFENFLAKVGGEWFINILPPPLSSFHDMGQKFTKGPSIYHVVKFLGFFTPPPQLSTWFMNDLKLSQPMYITLYRVGQKNFHPLYYLAM